MSIKRAMNYLDAEVRKHKKKSEEAEDIIVQVIEYTAVLLLSDVMIALHMMEQDE